MLDQVNCFDPYRVVPEVREFRRIDTIAAGRLTRENRSHARDDRQQYEPSH
jgi:hypothetical protein